MKQKNDTSNIEQIGKEFERRLVVMRYAEPTKRNYITVFNWIKKFLTSYGECRYTKEAGQRFLDEYILQKQHSPCSFKTAQIVVRRLDEILGGGEVASLLIVPKSKSECPERFRNNRDKYIEYLRKEHIVESTLKYHYNM